MRTMTMLPIALLVAGCGPSGQEIEAKRKAKERAKAAQVERDRVRTVVANTKQKMTRDFLDPSSVQYRNLWINGSELCGELNAKNTYGAYTGFDRFVAFGPFLNLESKTVEVGSKAIELGNRDDGENLVRGWRDSFELCMKKGVAVAH